MEDEINNETITTAAGTPGGDDDDTWRTVLMMNSTVPSDTSTDNSTTITVVYPDIEAAPPPPPPTGTASPPAPAAQGVVVADPNLQPEPQCPAEQQCLPCPASSGSSSALSREAINQATTTQQCCGRCCQTGHNARTCSGVPPTSHCNCMVINTNNGDSFGFFSGGNFSETLNSLDSVWSAEWESTIGCPLSEAVLVPFNGRVQCPALPSGPCTGCDSHTYLLGGTPSEYICMHCQTTDAVSISDILSRTPQVTSSDEEPTPEAPAADEAAAQEAQNAYTAEYVRQFTLADRPETEEGMQEMQEMQLEFEVDMIAASSNSSVPFPSIDEDEDQHDNVGELYDLLQEHFESLSPAPATTPEAPAPAPALTPGCKQR